MLEGFRIMLHKLSWKLVAVFLVVVGLAIGLLQTLGVVQVGGLMDWLTVLTFSAIAVLYWMRKRR